MAMVCVSECLSLCEKCVVLSVLSLLYIVSHFAVSISGRQYHINKNKVNIIMIM